MAVCLAFDTSQAWCAAALLRDGQTSTRIDAMARGQVEHLIGMLEEMLAGEGLAWRDLDVIGVGIGPGNFTGIRISVAAARGLALGLGVPAMGVSTFEIMRAGAGDEDLGPALIGLRAPRGAHYVQEFAGARPAGPPRQIGPRDVPEPGGTALLVLGDDAGLLAGRLGAARWREATLPAFGPVIARIALARWRGGETDPAPAAPLYVRAADAAPARDAPPVLLD